MADLAIREGNCHECSEPNPGPHCLAGPQGAVCCDADSECKEPAHNACMEACGDSTMWEEQLACTRTVHENVEACLQAMSEPECVLCGTLFGDCPAVTCDSFETKTCVNSGFSTVDNGLVEGADTVEGADAETCCRPDIIRSFLRIVSLRNRPDVQQVRPGRLHTLRVLDARKRTCG